MDSVRSVVFGNSSKVSLAGFAVLAVSLKLMVDSDEATYDNWPSLTIIQFSERPYPFLPACQP